MIHGHVYHNGRLLPIGDVRLSPGQAGLLSGWGIFTTLRIYSGGPFAFERHWRRLQKDAGRLHLPFTFDSSAVRAEVRELCRVNQVTEGTVRLYVVYNKIGFWQSDEELPQVDLILYTAGLPAFREPARLALRAHGRHAASPLTGVKVTSWLNNVWNLYEAQQRGLDEVVLLNERGEVAECTAANIFCVRDGKLLTPPLDSGCLEGVTRAVLLEIAPQSGVTAEERPLTPEELYSAEEVFITSTSRSLLGVAEIEGHRYAAAPGPVTRLLDAAFSAYVSDYLARAEALAPSAST